MSIFNDDQEKGEPKLCPFIGNMASPVIKRSEIAQAGMPPQIVSIEPKLFPCQGELCTFWSVEKERCIKRMEAEATVELAETMKRVERSLAPLSKFMGA
jgi:hypothetical protein